MNIWVKWTLQIKSFCPYNQHDLDISTTTIMQSIIHDISTTTIMLTCTSLTGSKQGKLQYHVQPCAIYLSTTCVFKTINNDADIGMLTCTSLTGIKQGKLQNLIERHCIKLLFFNDRETANTEKCFDRPWGTLKPMWQMQLWRHNSSRNVMQRGRGEVP